MSGCGLDVCGVTGKIGEDEGSLHCTEGERGRKGEREREIKNHKMAQNKVKVTC